MIDISNPPLEEKIAKEILKEIENSIKEFKEMVPIIRNLYDPKNSIKSINYIARKYELSTKKLLEIIEGDIYPELEGPQVKIRGESAFAPHIVKSF